MKPGYWAVLGLCLALGISMHNLGLSSWKQLRKAVVEFFQKLESPARGYVDFSKDVKLASSPVLRLLYFSLSWLFLGLGFLGIFLPILPTTPFVLLAGFFYAKSSRHFYNWLMNHPWFGAGLQDWRQSGAISFRGKVCAITVLWLTITCSIFMAPSLVLGVVLSLVALGVTWFLLTRPTSQVRDNWRNSDCGDTSKRLGVSSQTKLGERGREYP